MRPPQFGLEKSHFCCHGASEATMTACLSRDRGHDSKPQGPIRYLVCSRAFQRRLTIMQLQPQAIRRPVRATPLTDARPPPPHAPVCPAAAGTLHQAIMRGDFSARRAVEYRSKLLALLTTAQEVAQVGRLHQCSPCIRRCHLPRLARLS